MLGISAKAVGTKGGSCNGFLKGYNREEGKGEEWEVGEEEGEGMFGIFH